MKVNTGKLAIRRKAQSGNIDLSQMNIYFVASMHTRYLSPINNGQSKRLGDTGINTTFTCSCVNEGMELSGG